MNINTFVKAFNLWTEANSSDLMIIVSDKQHNGQVTSETFDDNVEWRDGNGDVMSKPANPTWAEIEAYKTAAEDVADYSN